jgi:hypothetical protein
MKRALLAAVAVLVMVGAGVGVFHERTAGDAYAQSAPLPLPSSSRRGRRFPKCPASIRTPPTTRPAPARD